MKPRLPAVALTRADWGIFLWLADRRSCSIEHLLLTCFTEDNRDGDLMLCLAELRVSGDCYLRIKVGVHWCDVIVPPIQVYIRKNPLWPSPGNIT